MTGLFRSGHSVIVTDQAPKVIGIYQTGFEIKLFLRLRNVVKDERWDVIVRRPVGPPGNNDMNPISWMLQRAWKPSVG